MAGFVNVAFIFVFGFTLWLGSYLLVRSGQNRSVLWIGLGLIVYAAIIALQILGLQAAGEPLQTFLRNLGNYLLLIPALFWGLAIFSIGSTAAGEAKSAPPSHQFRLSNFNFMQLNFTQLNFTQRGIGLVLVASILLGMSVGLVLMRLNWIPDGWLAFAIGADLCLLGYAIARLNAFDLGEALVPDFLRSFDGALLLVLLFAGPVWVAMRFVDDAQMVMLTLFLTMTAFAILVQTLRSPFEAALDRVAFGATSPIPQQRAELRAAVEAIPKIEQNADTNTLDEAEFARLTRRALSSYGDLSRLAASPLAQLPLIESGLSEQGVDVNTLTRATELKRLLTQGIEHLKPLGEDEFDSTDEWRYYNALYFPYVMGLRPYSRRAEYTDLEPAPQAALDWFRSQVPERTLHNWQNAAAKLVAQYLRELGA